MSAPDTSSISFTAHYTGYVWYRQQWSDKHFVSLQGCCLYGLMQPFELLARMCFGTDIKTTLLTRHALIDRELEKALNTGTTQVLELACGLSPRGWKLRQRHPQLRYIEADLPGMAKRKASLLERMGVDDSMHQVVRCNILAEHGLESLESVLATHFDIDKPIIIITEGLINYFPLTTLAGFWRRINLSLKRFPQGIYLTDLYPEVREHRLFRLVQMANRLLGTATRSHFTMHFSTDDEARQFMMKQGFATVSVLNPDQELNESRLPKARGGSLVRVLSARPD